MERVRAQVGTAGVERLHPDGVRLLIDAVLFDGAGVPAWHALAACRDLPREAFFPESAPDADATVRTAKRVCAGCPVRRECLDDVMAWEQQSYRFGVVGGLSASDRRRLWSRGEAAGTEIGGVAA